ncbi:MAG: hypothetical protein QXN55_08545 [Candidatus Nitrosotenuis sp.]
MKKSTTTILSIGMCLGGIVFGYFLFAYTLTPTTLLENEALQDSTIHTILDDPTSRLKIINEINKNDKFSLEFLTNPQSQRLVQATRTFEMGGILADSEHQYNKTSSKDLETIKYQMNLVKKLVAEKKWKDAYALATLTYVDHFDPISNSVYQSNKEIESKLTIMMRDDLREMITREDDPAKIGLFIDEINETLDNLIVKP